MKLWASILAVGVLLGAGIATSGGVQAAQIQNEETVIVASDETVADDLFTAGETIRIEGTVEGDVYAGGQQVVVNGHIMGSLFAGANNITINGTVDGGVRAASSSLNFSGAQIGGGVTYFGSTFSSNQDTTIGHGVLLFGNNADIDGSVGHGVTGFANSVTLRGDIGTDSEITSTNLTIADTAEIEQNVAFYSDNRAEVAEGANIAGEISHQQMPEKHLSGIGGLQYMSLFWALLSTLIVGGLLLWLGRKSFSDTALRLSKQPLASFGYGLLGLIVVGPLSVLLLLTVIGIPLAILLWVFVGVSIYLSMIVVGISLGRWILQRFNSKQQPKLFASFAAGTVVLYALHALATLLSLPILTFLISIIVVTAGFGAILLKSYTFLRLQRSRK